ncbi:hypothetical protein EHW99_2756 [Erwinia amylovora]|uniref:Uncharacterized protein n=2 Tax=Erwinia amylovora TaxID=552 RepID=A0A831EJ07_ERWAM|nr:hypothetical protein EaACW_0833 [Erwinia amylovora ACW56400]QJQ55457.1 hypothetical protein EHX00_2756 [Erwinia amylovora]CBA19775.1 hypothetical protein predicted by Glimmer/Critica [Erwinia amylovora CFBP1430]CCO77679.1 hypothetical protein BN432_0856 [Erwinia amylovora Ea356]CCO81463.1 hypothetical protein BN433_0866 [Erwinia amylovora Ea266]CCO85265.1 hypothetical protein BN434_0852 [Erwinia amylovora CFBP 2585]CCO89050.1 hypothetical protein BN435_0852 [Erwinia amylovora 01SFR-BO]CCO
MQLYHNEYIKQRVVYTLITRVKKFGRLINKSLFNHEIKLNNH